jgi:hypothetical protein
MEHFAFTSPKLPALKAKQLHRAFPFLKLSAAQEATARAMGYSSWYECLNRGTSGRPSLSDQAAGIPTRVARLYHQASVLTGIGIAPGHADSWVRAWGLTGAPTLAPSKAGSHYYRWLDAAKRVQRGEFSEQQIALKWPEADWSKHPDVDRAVEVCPGIVLSPCGKYPHYAVDPAILAHAPAYLRGARNLYHYEDDGSVLTAMVSGFCEEHSEPIAERLNHLQYEWHFGTKHPQAEAPVLPQLQAAALNSPNALVIISIRATPTSSHDYDFDRFAVACLRGVDFAAFLASKGHLDPSKVVWYSDVRRDGLPRHPHWLDGYGAAVALPILESASTRQPSLPVYSYPFKDAPMASDEYSTSLEMTPMIALHLDYTDDSDDANDDEGGDDSDDGNDPVDPAGTLNLEAQPA